MGQTQQHQFIHQIDDLGFRHELLLERLDSHWESRTEHDQRAFRVQVPDQFLNILLEVALQQSVCLIQHEELTIDQQVLVPFQQVFQSAWCTYCQMRTLLLYRVVVVLDKGTADEVGNVDLGEF
jgi:hypothetical protein